MFEVIDGGFETSIQDHPGRIGHYSIGVPPSGPFDTLAFRLGNSLVNNPASEAGLEITILGPKLRCISDTVVALTGADLSPTLNEHSMPMWKPVKVRTNDVLSFGTCRSGCRAYLSISGGVDAPVRYGSRSTYKLGSMGGLRGDGKPLRRGDVVKTRVSTPLPDLKDRRVKPVRIPSYSNQWEVRVVAGPQDDYYTDPSLDLFTRGTYDFTVSPLSNRVGVRLRGPGTYEYKPAGQRPSSNQGHPSNIVLVNYPVGTVNMAGDQPIVLGPDLVSLGGYCCIVTVISADLWKVGQCKPGDKIRFTAVTPADARKLRQTLEESIDESVIEN